MSGVTFGGGTSPEPPEPPGPSGPDLQAVPEPEPEETTEDPATVLASVRAEWDRATEERTLDIDLPGSHGNFVLRLAPIRGSVLSKLRQRLEASRSPERDLNLNADVLIAATRGVLGRSSGAKPLVQLEDEEGPLLRIDDRLGRALGLDDKTTARAVVGALFRHANVPDLAIATAATAYFEWAASADADVGEELLGES
jgi:hypothetical protein